MATIQRFEDMVAWQKSRELVREVYKALANCRDHGFKDQIQRASVSVMSNIAEGFESGTRQEFLNYLYIAKGSAGEVRAQLYAAHDIGYLNIETFKYLNGLALDCSRLIASFVKGLKTSPVEGMQRKRVKSRHELEKEEAERWIEQRFKEIQEQHNNSAVSKQ
jgi:four helix bundle protein